jgi:subtilase family serine protease
MRLRSLLLGALSASMPLVAAASPTSFADALPQAVANHTAALLGALSPDQTMQISVSLPMRNQPARDQLLAAIYNPASPLYRHYLSVADYTARFGPTASDYATAAAYFASQGLTVRADAANHALIQITGTVANLQRVFHVALNLYRHPTENRSFYAPDRAPTVDLAVPLLDVIGLDNYVLPTPRLIRAKGASLGTQGTGSGPHGYFIGSDMRAAYYGNGPLTGAGQSVGLMELAGYNLASVQTYFTTVGQPLNVPVIGVKTDILGLSCTGHCDDGEQALDIEYAISMAPGLAQVQVYVGKLPEDVLNAQVSDNTSAELSTSWGWGTRYAHTDDAIFQQMAIQGQTMLTASGDYSSLAASDPWPEEDANLTAVGGTDLVTNGPGGPWVSETGWSGSAGGPSLAKIITIEPYQTRYITAANQGSTLVRNVPDIAAQADINMIFCENLGCGVAGGTSFASPMWAGFVALANQQAQNTGHGRTGFINPTLYAHGKDANVATLIHDVTSGRSGKYRATKSYDLVTGLGTPAAGLINILAGVN